MSTEPSRRAAAAALLDSPGMADPESFQRLVPLIYEELRALARRQLAKEHGDITVQTTELVHEAYLRLVDNTRATSRGRAYFFAAAARAMRQVLTDAARRRGAAKRGSGVAPLPLDEAHALVDGYAADLLDIDGALELLEQHNPRHVQVVECRYFAGMSVEETAEALGVSARTVKNDWALARAWLYRQLRGTEADRNG